MKKYAWFIQHSGNADTGWLRSMRGSTRAFIKDERVVSYYRHMDGQTFFPHKTPLIPGSVSVKDEMKLFQRIIEHEQCPRHETQTFVCRGANRPATRDDFHAIYGSNIPRTHVNDFYFFGEYNYYVFLDYAKGGRDWIPWKLESLE